MMICRSTILCWIIALTLFTPFACTTVPPDREGEIILQEKQPEKVSVAVTPEPQYYVHTIKWPGENLIKISRWYTGSGNNWQLLVDANPAIDPNRMKIGDAIRIPEELIRTHEPMPKNYRVPITPSKENTAEPSELQQTAQPPEDSPANTEEIELFGPVDLDTKTASPAKTGPSLPLETIE